MCIIAIKPKGVNAPNKEILENMFASNPDGAGVAFNLNGKLNIIKGLMTFEEFWNVCKGIPKESAAIYHARIETSGGVCKELTHPFIISSDIFELRKTNYSTTKGEALAHNGVFNEFLHKYFNNDTTQFITSYIYPLKKLKDETNQSLLDGNLDSVIKKLCGSSNKIAIINQDGDIKRYGDGWILDNGIYYSNYTYESRTYTYRTLYDDSCLNWRKPTISLGGKLKTREKIKRLRATNIEFESLYEQWHNKMSDEELLEYFERGWI